MNEKIWMIYGCYGYTGGLIVEEAVSRGLRPVLAGRNRGKLEKMAGRFDLDYQCFELAPPESLVSRLKGISLLLNCAGPFTATGPPLVRTCIKAKCNYLDITGEIDVLEHLHSMNEKAQDAGVVVCPGTGFDVIPTDCLAASLNEIVPDARYLALGFDSKGPLSPGTAVTIIEGLQNKGKVRKRKVIVTVPLAHRSRTIDFGAGPKTAVTIPWGDVSTAFHTTGIPNIEVYAPVGDKAVKWIKIMRIFRPLVCLKPIRKTLERIIREVVKGPSAMARKKNAPVYLWAEVVGPDGKSKTARLKTANGYDVTVHGAIGMVERLLASSERPGVHTPSQLMGVRYICKLPGSGEIRITP